MTVKLRKNHDRRKQTTQRQKDKCLAYSKLSLLISGRFWYASDTALTGMAYHHPAYSGIAWKNPLQKPTTRQKDQIDHFD